MRAMATRISRRIMRMFAVLLAALIAVLGVTTLAAGAALASSPTVAYGVPNGHSGSNFVHGRVRPLGLLVWAADGSHYFVIHSWGSWRQGYAWGSATVHVRSCWGSCFRYKTERTALHFYRVRTHRGRPYFTRLPFSLAHKVGGTGSGTLVFSSRGLPAWGVN